MLLYSQQRFERFGFNFKRPSCHRRPFSKHTNRSCRQSSGSSHSMSVWGPPRSSQYVEGRGTPVRSSIARKDGAGGERKRHLGSQPDHSGSEPSTPTRTSRRPGPPHERAAAPSSVPSTAKSRLSQQPASPAPARGAQHARGVTNPAFSPDKLRQPAAHGAAAHTAAPVGERGPSVRASLSLKGHAGKSRPDGTPRAVRAKPTAPAAPRGGAAAVRASAVAPQPWPTPPALASLAGDAAVGPTMTGPSPAATPLPVAIDNPLAGSSPTTSSGPLARSASAPPTTPTGATFRTLAGGEELATPTLAHWRAPAAAEADQRGAGTAGTPSSSHRPHTPGSGDRSIGPLAPHVLEALRVSLDSARTGDCSTFNTTQHRIGSVETKPHAECQQIVASSVATHRIPNPCCAVQSPQTPESEQALAQLKAEALRMRRASSGNSQRSDGAAGQADGGTPQAELTFQEVTIFMTSVHAEVHAALVGAMHRLVIKAQHADHVREP